MLLARLASLILCFAAFAIAGETRNIILVTSDGLRWQELFNGIDPMLASEKTAGMDKAEARRKKYQLVTLTERRRAMAPFFWTQIAQRGIVSNDVHVTNAFRVSYPGYSEILTGRANDAQIRSNDPIRNPNQTVLEFLKDKLKLPKERVALFASWQTFQQIGEHEEGSIYINAGYEAPKGPLLSQRFAQLGREQFDMLTPWDESRHDYITSSLALEYMRIVRPRVMMVSFDETDDWAHDHRYDRVLDSIAEFDRFLERLWNTIESMKEYRGHTTVIVTTDHGRGSTLEDWNSHGGKVPGADRIWMAILGPDTPTGGETNFKAQQRDIAATMIKLMGFDPKEYSGATGSVIQAAFKQP